MTDRKKLTIGILAHVDSGKTTLSEALLFKGGVIKKQGRVDSGSAFMDRQEMERKRGITIFFGQAELPLKSMDVTIIDTPGHVDFSAETERVLNVLDCAILVVSARDGVQSHTVTLWRLLREMGIPTIIFVNKMDISISSREEIIDELRRTLGDGCFAPDCNGEISEKEIENVASSDELLLEEYFNSGSLSKEEVLKATASGNVFPCFFGSALKMEGIDEFIDGFIMFAGMIKTRRPLHDISGGEFSAKTFKITREKQEKLTHLKVTSGMIRVRDSVFHNGEDIGRINQIRIYSGEKYRTVTEACEGTVCTVTGLNTVPADTGGIQPVMACGVILPETVKAHDALMNFKELEEEEPGLNVTWNEEYEEIRLSLMGTVQMEVLQGIVRERFGFDIEFGEEKIRYKETVSQDVKGAGHFEPLRHYAEVHLLLEPLEPGSGIRTGSLCDEDSLDRNWQRLITTHIEEKEHRGPLTGSPVTDIKFSILGGRAHGKHTEGGDFRQATYRAIAQALRKSKRDGDMILLEPWYKFRIDVPMDSVGRVMADIRRMSGEFDEPRIFSAGNAVIEGRAPVSEIKSYPGQLAAFTGGRGQLTCEYDGYFPCHNSEEVIDEISYDPDSDSSIHSDSIFCVHGAGRSVPWYESDDMMHVSCCSPGEAEIPEAEYVRRECRSSSGPGNDDENLMRIFDRNLSANRKDGKKKPRVAAREIESKATHAKHTAAEKLPEFLIVDGYNIIFAWEELKELAKVNIDSAVDALVEIMGNYRGYRECRAAVVFDAYKVSGGRRHSENRHGIEVVFTKEDETADTYIERTAYEARKSYTVRVATSDRLEQMITRGNNAMVISAADFRKEVEQVELCIKEALERNNRKNKIEHRNTINIRKGGKNEEKN